MLDLAQFAASIVEHPVPFRDKGRDRAGLDCWGLIWLAYREVYGIQLPSLDWLYPDTSNPQTLEDVVKREQMERWREVADPQPGDVVVFRVMGRHSHVGLVLGGGQFLHIQEGATEVAVERYDGALWGRRVEDFWRHADRA